MSYYFTNPYNFTSHSLLRIRERLGFKNMTDVEICSRCLKLITESFDIIETRHYKYVRVNQTNFYFIIENQQNLVLTLSIISQAKLLTILESN